MPFDLEKAMDNLAIRRGKKILIFEYGTLMHDHDPPYTEDAWKSAEIYGNLHQAGLYKGATDIGKTSNKIKGEVAEISAHELESLDKREGVKKGEYTRIKTKTLDGLEVYTYQWTGKKLSKAEFKAPPRAKLRALMNSPQVSQKKADKETPAPSPAGVPPLIDAEKHAEPGWEGYNSHVIHGLDHTKSVMERTANSFTPHLAFVGKPGATKPHAIIKGPIPGTTFGYSGRSFADPKFTTSHREAAYHKMANEVFGLGDYVPATTVFKHPKHGNTWSAQEFVKGEPFKDEFMGGDHDQFRHMEPEIHKLAIMNTILGNGDRHEGNFLVGQDHNRKARPILIDNGLAFDYHNVMAQSDPGYAREQMERPVPKEVEDWLWSLDAEKLAKKMHEAGLPHDAVMTAVQRLAATRRWSNLLKHGHSVYGAETMKHANRSLRTLMNSIKIHRLDYDSPELRGNAMKFVEDMMLGRAKDIDDAKKKQAERDKQHAPTEMVPAGSFTKRRTPEPVRTGTKIRGAK